MTIPTTPPDMTAVIINIVKAGLPPSAKAGRTRGSEPQFVQVRADLQGPAAPISRYCRIGLSTWWLDSSGHARIDEAFDLSALAARLILESRDPRIIHGEWQSGPFPTVDAISQQEIAYSTLLLEVASIV